MISGFNSFFCFRLVIYTVACTRRLLFPCWNPVNSKETSVWIFLWWTAESEVTIILHFLYIIIKAKDWQKLSVERMSFLGEGSCSKHHNNYCEACFKNSGQTSMSSPEIYRKTRYVLFHLNFYVSGVPGKFRILTCALCKMHWGSCGSDWLWAKELHTSTQ